MNSTVLNIFRNILTRENEIQRKRDIFIFQGICFVHNGNQITAHKSHVKFVQYFHMRTKNFNVVFIKMCEIKGCENANFTHLFHCHILNCTDTHIWTASSHVLNPLLKMNFVRRQNITVSGTFVL